MTAENWPGTAQRAALSDLRVGPERFINSAAQI